MSGDAPLLAWPQVVVNGSRARTNRRVHTRECQSLRQAAARRDAHPLELRDLPVCDYCSGAYDPSAVEQDRSYIDALRRAAGGDA